LKGGVERFDDPLKVPAMIDLTTQEPILVHTEGPGRPYIMIPVDQLDAVGAILQANNVSH